LVAEDHTLRGQDAELMISRSFAPVLGNKSLIFRAEMSENSINHFIQIEVVPLLGSRRLVDFERLEKNRSSV
jgi:hypothetical protein